MSIRVTCIKCHSRFNVSDRFAGRTGPCPKCKAMIEIPKVEDQISVKTPSAGPLDSEGRPIVKPITRSETKLSTLQLVIIGACVVGFLACSVLLQSVYQDASEFPWLLLLVAALVLAVPLVYAGYAFLRDPDLESYLGKELWARVGLCSLGFAATWIALPVAAYAFGDSYEVGSYVLGGTAMLAVGGVASMLCFGFDFFMGVVHFGLYMSLGLLGRYLAGIGVLPQNLIDPDLPMHLAFLEWGSSLTSLIPVWFG